MKSAARVGAVLVLLVLRTAAPLERRTDADLANTDLANAPLGLATRRELTDAGTGANSVNASAADEGSDSALETSATATANSSLAPFDDASDNNRDAHAVSLAEEHAQPDSLYDSVGVGVSAPFLGGMMIGLVVVRRISRASARADEYETIRGSCWSRRRSREQEYARTSMSSGDLSVA